MRDCNVPDGSKFAPSTRFNKGWLLKNSGTLNWKQNDVKLVNVAGNISSLVKYVQMPSVDQDEIVEVQVGLIAPSQPGIYYSEWVLMCRNFIFGPRIWCKIEVLNEDG